MNRSALTLFLLTILSSSLADAESKKKTSGANEPGVFDYYILTLSWSPQYCETRTNADPSQCGQGRKFGFVVHGLWPQHDHGYPRDCGPKTRVAEAIFESMLPIMPSRNLIQHQWNAHGTCSGMDDARYFEDTRCLFSNLRIPEVYKQPLDRITVKPKEVKANFRKFNPAIKADGIRVLCSGRFLNEVRICYTRDLQFRACGAGVRDGCRSDEIIMQPVR